MAAGISPPAIILGLLFILSLFSTSVSSAEAEENLLAFRSSLEDPTNALSGWSPAAGHVCNWTGVTCDPSSGRVASLVLRSLNLSGEISPSLCRLAGLSELNLAGNFFNQSIPLHLAQCTSLQALNLSNNLLWGTLPDQISQLRSLTSLDLSGNKLEGALPIGLGALDRLRVLNLGGNMFTGALHISIFGNLSDLVHIDISQNPSFSSELPPQLGNLKKLRKILMQSAGLRGGIPQSFVGLGELEILDLSRNNLSGKIPVGFGLRLAKLVYLDLSQNRLSGSFPGEICSGMVLAELNLHTNSFSGELPESMGSCSNLERLQLQNGGFSGEFPSGLWALSKMTVIRAENNRFSGEIPDYIRTASRLELVQIDNNSFSGRIPPGFGMISSLYRFSASMNGFYGELPENFCDSPAMSIISFSHNSLTGSIPSPRRCRKLVSLSLAGNHFTGEIPNSLTQLPVLTYLDLSDNNLSGEIPQGLQNLKLALLNVSFNQLSGEVPLPLISGLPASFLQGNPGLCGPGLANPCGAEEAQKRRNLSLTYALISIAFAGGVILVAAALYVKNQSLRRKARRAHSASWKSVLYYPLRITEDDLLMRFNESNCVGRGAFGEVYAIRLPGGEVVAAKKLIYPTNLSMRSLKTEIKTLAKARHKNLTKLLGFCYSEGIVVLIYESLPKGSLGDAISRSGFSMEWPTRLRIAMGAAQALSYLHEHYVPTLLHRNVKSRNVLLDVDYEPKLTDFGLDRVLGESSYGSSMASELGSRCYLAPECGYSKKATEKMDVYSFGVLLLELVTGRPAEQPEPRDSLDVVRWVRRRINTDNRFQILDQKISGTALPSISGALDLALRCTAVSPEKRPTMLEVLRSLQSLESAADPPPVLSADTSYSGNP
ncbi:unnamed protein product [Spirodela intermedia]|uniref:Protein kinase domain-containing protein n=1 Tax=Spirodela intermedia TaxID=51605 RepID=A0A7I8LFE7_SPIIN|nr:unnamed protein product [Spirodela intermedia]